MKSLRQRTVSGLGWNAATQALAKALQFVVLIFLAHLLSPHEFGLVGMIYVFTGFASSIADMGLNASIIQSKELSDESLDTAFWLNIAIGSLLVIIFIFSSPLIVEFYGEPQLRLLTVVLAFNFIFESAAVVQYALLQKSIDFRSRFLIEIIAIPLSGIIAIILAWTGAGVWSLVAQLVCGSAIRTATLWYLSSWRPRLRFSASTIRRFVVFGKYLTGSNIVIYCAQHFDKLVIGNQIGSAALGIYSLSDRLMRVPLTNVTAIAGSVMFPAFSELQDNNETAKRAYLQANRMIALLTFPMVLGLCALAQPAIMVVYGARWHEAVPVVQVLCLAGLGQSVYNTASWIFLSRGRPDILFRLGILSMTVRGAGALIGMRWGLLGIAWAYMLGGYLFIMYPTWSAAGNLIGLRFTELLRNVAGPFFSAAAMALVIWLSDQLLFAQSPSWLRLAVHVVIGAIVYGALIAAFRLKAWQEVRALIPRMDGLRNRFLIFRG